MGPTYAAYSNRKNCRLEAALMRPSRIICDDLEISWEMRKIKDRQPDRQRDRETEGRLKGDLGKTESRADLNDLPRPPD